MPHPVSRIPYSVSSLFSFNHQHGACPACDGLGFQTVCDPDQLVTDPSRSIMDGAMDGTRTGKFYGDPFGQHVATLRAAGARYGIDFLKPWEDLPAEAKKLALEGTGEEIYEVNWQFRRDNRTGEHHFNGPWTGLINLVNAEYSRKHADHRGESMMTIMKTVPCPSCSGSRLRPEALAFRILGKDISGLSALSVAGSISFFKELSEIEASPDERGIILSLVPDIMKKLEFLSGLGLAYLTLNRCSSTLSGGEAQRVRLAAQLGSAMTGITYVLDEPTIGLHPRDTKRLMQLIRKLKEAGNTVLIVEHDREVIMAADHVIDMGPGAGKDGGRILAAGTPEEIIANPASVTGPWLVPGKIDTGAGLAGQSAPTETGNMGTALSIRNAFANNLKGFDLDIPAGGITAVTGVSGSGKSTLLYDVILASHAGHRATGCSSVSGFEKFSRIVSVHPRTGFSNSLATPATFTGLFDHVRDLFAATARARTAGFGKNHFSFLNKAGQCPACGGTGQVRISMDFLSDVRMTCEKCRGKRFREEILQCTLDGKNIGEVLAMTVTEAAVFFSSHQAVAGIIQTLVKVGLGYLELGQSLDTLSGGEAQRLVLATELLKPVRGKALYLFEEPSTGLHFIDIAYLLALFRQLAGQGHTLLVIEHDPDIISQADHIIELGPEGGNLGGYLLRPR